MKDVHWVIIITLVVLIVICTSSYCDCNVDERVIWFYRDGCGFCTKMIEEWDRFVLMRPKYILVEKINTADPANQEMVEDYGVVGVPHIVKVKDGRRYVYNGPRIAESLLSWAIM